MSGWIKIHRTIRSHWIWKDDKKLKWWLDILMEVNHDDNKVSIGLDVINCKRGQSLNSLATWSERWNVSRSTVRDFLKMLKEDGMIEIESLKKSTQITVCNYDRYQTEPNTCRTLSDTNKNVKKDMNVVESFYRTELDKSGNDKLYKSFVTFLFKPKPLPVLNLRQQIGWEDFQVLQRKIGLMKEQKGYTGTLKQKVEGYINGGYRKKTFFGTMNTWVNGDANRIKVKLPDTDELRKGIRNEKKHTN